MQPMSMLSSPMMMNQGIRRPDMREELKTESPDAFVPLPRGIFYTDEGRESANHQGYLRLIPLSFENEVTECSDYQDLVKVVSERGSEG